MTVFDTIRYPITDIYNQAQMEQLPVGLFEQWLSLCNGNKIQLPEHADMKQLVIHDIVTQLIINKKSRLYPEGNYDNETSSTIYELIERHFQDQLKYVIANYDM